MIGGFFKYILILIVVAVVIIGALAIALPSMVSEEEIKKHIVDAVKENTGKELEIKGNASFALVPTLSLKFSNARLTDPEQQGKFHDIPNFRLEASMLSLFNRNPDISMKFRLNDEDFVVNLRVKGMRRERGGESGESSATVAKIDSVVLEMLKPVAARISTSVDTDGDKTSLKNLVATILDAKVEGEMQITSLKGEKPYIVGDFSLGVVDVDEITKQLTPLISTLSWQDESGGTAYNAVPVEVADNSGVIGYKGADGEIWSREPLDFSFLNAFNARIAARFGSMKVYNIAVGKTSMTAYVNGGKATLDLTEMQLYGGSGNGVATVDSSGDILSTTKSYEFKGIEIGNFLADAVQFKRLKGKGDMKFNMSASGNSLAEMVSNTHGTGNVQLLEGKILGVDVTSMLTQKLLGGSLDSNQDTEILGLTGSYQIERGILYNNDLTVNTPAVNLAGRGTININQLTIGYTVTPSRTITGQKLIVPLLIQGDLRKPDFRLDVGNVAKQSAGEFLQDNKEVQKFRDKLNEKSPGLGDTLQNNLLKGLFGD